MLLVDTEMLLKVDPIGPIFTPLMDVTCLTSTQTKYKLYILIQCGTTSNLMFYLLRLGYFLRFYRHQFVFFPIYPNNLE